MKSDTTMIPATRARAAAADSPARTGSPRVPPTRVPAGGATRARAAQRRGSSARQPRTLGRALLATAAATVAPGSGHLILRRQRTGALILGVFLLLLVALVALGLSARRAELLENLLSTRVLTVVVVGCIVAALAWMAVIVHTYLLARPRKLGVGPQVLGVVVVTALCLTVAAPFGFGANLANSQRNLLDSLFAGGGGTAAAEAIAKPRLNILLVGSDAGPDRAGTRTDTMMVASVDTRTSRTTLFSLPRNIGHAQFPPGSPMAEKFPKGFFDKADPLSGNYLLNAVYAYALEYPALAPSGPTADPGLNMLNQTVSYMLGLQLDYYVEVNMAGFASIIDAVGGITVDVGPEPLPIGGVLPDGRHVKPDGYVPAGVQHLDGEQALWFARSRRNSDDYSRMGRQRCLLSNLLQQKSPTDVLTNFQAIAAVATRNVSTNIPQQVLPALVKLAGGGNVSLESVSFDPNLPDPNSKSGKFDTLSPDFEYMREVVQNSINRPPPPPAPSAAPTLAAAPTTTKSRSSSGSKSPTTTAAAPDSAQPESLTQACG
ncbi:LCP family protein [Pseudonocardia xinjiangensis]|uniref:LCP family protein n=1 Tax=Pseudonocardia xinjiangensis TaxID=75289 RepID=UPI003D8CBED8